MAKASAPPAPTTRDLLKQQFAALCQQRDAALAEATRLRGQRDDLIVAAEASLKQKVDPLDQAIAAAEAPLAALHREIAQVAQALDGQTA